MNFSKLLSLQGYFELSHKLKSLLNLSNDLPSSRPESQTSAGFVKSKIMPNAILTYVQDQKRFIGLSIHYRQKDLLREAERGLNFPSLKMFSFHKFISCLCPVFRYPDWLVEKVAEAVTRQFETYVQKQ